jgi:hypothetical protein
LYKGRQGVKEIIAWKETAYLIILYSQGIRKPLVVNRPRISPIDTKINGARFLLILSSEDEDRDPWDYLTVNSFSPGSITDLKSSSDQANTRVRLGGTK